MSDPKVPEEDEEAVLERYRQMRPGEKLWMVMELSAAGWEEEYAKVRAQYGQNVSEREVRLRAAAHVYLKERDWEDRTGLEEYFRQAFKEAGIDPGAD
ncbi:MAG TPA: hypothetical protein VGG03_26670 [Thermoanaerobaculia bacterium]|jgi:hypothetical protein